MTHKFKVIILATLICFMADSVMAGSIWAKRHKNMKSIYADDTARQVGDVLTIIIYEDSQIDNKVSRDLDNSNSRSSSFDGDLNIDHILPSIPGFTMSQSSSRKLSGQSDYKDERSFEDRITVVVEDIHPNGNLVVVGTRTRDLSGDKQTILVSGIVRPSDVAFDNTILSQQVANFNLLTMNKGVSEDYNKPGWLGNIFDTLWPF